MAMHRLAKVSQVKLGMTSSAAAVVAAVVVVTVSVIVPRAPIWTASRSQIYRKVLNR